MIVKFYNPYTKAWQIYDNIDSVEYDDYPHQMTEHEILSCDRGQKEPVLRVGDVYETGALMDYDERYGFYDDSEKGDPGAATTPMPFKYKFKDIYLTKRVGDRDFVRHVMYNTEAYLLNDNGKTVDNISINYRK